MTVTLGVLFGGRISVIRRSRDAGWTSRWEMMLNTLPVDSMGEVEWNDLNFYCWVHYTPI
jgi:hypothetical protein